MNNDFLEDFEYLYNLLYENAYYFSEMISDKIGYNPLSQEIKEDYIKRLEKIESKEEYVNLINEYINLFKNGHIKVIGQEDSTEHTSYYKTILKYVKGSYYVAFSDDENIVGKRIIKIDGLTPDEYVLNKNPGKFIYDFKRNKEYRSQSLLKSKQEKNLQVVLGDEENNSEYTLEDSVDINTLKKIIIDSYKLKLANKENNSLSSNSGNILLQVFGDVLYLKISSFNDELADLDESFFEQKVQEIVNSPQIKNLIIDTRGNVGGSDRYFKNFGYVSDKDINHEASIYDCESKEVKIISQGGFKSENERKLDIERYVLIDGNVYSTADGFAKLCKDSKWATLVGQASSGDGIGLTPITVTLPLTGVEIQYTNTYPTNDRGDIDRENFFTFPDIYVEDESVDLFSQGDIDKDSVLRYTLDYISKNKEEEEKQII